MPVEPATLEQPTAASFSSTLMRGDRTLWGIYLALIVISIVEMYSASSMLTYKAASFSDPVFRHIRHLLLGMVFIVFFQNASLVAIRQWGNLLYWGGLLLLLLLPFLGTQMKGAYRDVFGIQPVEPVKLGTMLLLCELLTVGNVVIQHFHSWFRIKTERQRYWLLLLVVGVVGIPIAAQNLSSGLIIAFASLALMYLGKVRNLYLVYTILGVLAVALVSCALLFWQHSYNEQCREKGEEILRLSFPLHRAHIWADRLYDGHDAPLWEQDQTGEKAQEIYAHMALANSYPLGRGPGNSRLRDFLPEAFSDYIYAIIFEEMGFLGALLVLVLYLWLLWRCYQLSRRTEHVYIRLLMISLPLIMVIQALIHIGVCTGAMFVTGQPLPLLSRGGSSIIFTSISFGLMFALSRIIENEDAQRPLASADGRTPARHTVGTRIEGEGVRVGQ